MLFWRHDIYTRGGQPSQPQLQTRDDLQAMSFTDCLWGGTILFILPASISVFAGSELIPRS
jgi:hypothetical protein